MKKLLFMCLALLMGAGAASADNKPKAEKKIVITVFTTDIDCEHCKKKVLDTMPFERGVKDVEVDLKAKKVTVTYDASKTCDEALVSAFAGIRVKAVKEESR